VTFVLFPLVGSAHGAQPVRLLVLRVFSLGSRSERLFARFSKLWRHHGDIRLIAGPDLAATTVEPHEFLDFLSGRLQRRFIGGTLDFEARLAEAEPLRDRDGRYRIADFFCHDDTWRMVLARLAQDCDVVLMDLRGFTKRNQGCIFEINELVGKVPLSRSVFIVDASTDEPFLCRTFQEAWQRSGARSVNNAELAPRIRLYRPVEGSGRSIAALVAVLAGMSQSPSRAT
jgi:hypothetical protein